jgi:hypothetical protein
VAKQDSTRTGLLKICHYERSGDRVRRFSPILQKRLVPAGWRLAWLLNAAFLWIAAAAMDKDSRLLFGYRSELVWGSLLALIGVELLDSLDDRSPEGSFKRLGWLFGTSDANSTRAVFRR